MMDMEKDATSGLSAPAQKRGSAEAGRDDMEPDTTPGNDTLFRLYSKRILALTTELAEIGRLENPDATVTKRSPLCGSTVTVDLRMRDGRVAEYGHDVKACALGQASSAVLGKHVHGMSARELHQLRDQLEAMLRSNAPPPDGAFGELEVLLPAREFKNRHASILLAYNAAAEAADIAERTDDP